ncbi:MAG: TetR/AcrR family transcriptional regulator [Spirochaetia bacterium]
MPKIIDHEEYRNEISKKAVDIFRACGYRGIGMRKIAGILGISKSALYHYFPTKEALFLECTKHVSEIQIDTTLPPGQAIVQWAKGWDSVFPGELRIMLDYVNSRDPEELQKDTAVTVFMDGISKSLAPVIGEDRINIVLSTVFGFLLLRFFTGKSPGFKELEKMLENHILK